MILGVVASSIDKVVAASETTVYVFDGAATSYLKIDQTTIVDGIVNQTWVVRAKTSLSDGDNRAFIGQADGDIKLTLKIDGSDNLDAYLSDTGTSSCIDKTWTTDTGWHQFAFTYDGTDMKIYVDGVEKGTSADPDFTARTAGREVYIGASSPGYYLHGEMSDVQFYSRALSQPELDALNTDITDLPTDHATYLEANFAANKTATTWTSEVNSYTATNQGDVILFEGNDFYPQNDAASVSTEVNSIGSWINDRATITVNSSDYINGIYSIDIEANITDSRRGEILIKRLTIGTSYRVTWQNKFIQAKASPDCRIYVWTGCEVSPNYANVELETTWTEHSEVITANAVEVLARFYVVANAHDGIGDVLLVDNFSFVETFNPDYQAILDRADVQGYTKPSAAQQIIQNQLLIDLKSNGVWAETDLLYIPANDGSEDFSKLNWKSPSTFELTKGGTVTWTENIGWQGDGSTGYLDTTWDANTNAVKYLYDSARIDIYISIQQTQTQGNSFYYFAGADRFSGDCNMNIYDEDSVNKRLGMDMHTAGKQFLNDANIDYTGLVTAIMDDAATNESRLYKADSLEINAAETAETFDQSYDVFISALSNEGTASNFSDIQWGWFSVGSAQIVNQATINTLIEDYMRAVTPIKMKFITNSLSATWASGFSISNSGAALHWEVTGTGITDSNQTTDSPSFDFSANTGNADITVTVTSADNFIGLTTFWLWYGEIISVTDINGPNITSFSCRANYSLTDISIANLTGLITCYAHECDLSLSVANQIVIDLETTGKSSGVLNLLGNNGIDSTCNTAYDALIGRSYTIDIADPVP